MLNTLIKKIDRLAALRFFPALAAVCAAVLTSPEVLNLFSGSPEGYFYIGPAAQFIDSGKSLFYGLRDAAAGGKMPLFSFISAAFLDPFSRQGTNVLLLLFNSGIYFLCFTAGRAGRSAFAGLAALVAALALNLAGAANYEMEQAVYTFFLMLLLNLLVRGRPGGFFRASALGLAVGFTLLVRSPLFLFPVFLPAWDFALRKITGAAGPAARRGWLVFLAASYLLLGPWLGVNYFLHRKFIPFEANRADNNVIAAALGSVYTLEFDGRALAGLGQNDSALAWAAKETARHPVRSAAAFFKRLAVIFLLQPLLLPLILAALLFYRTQATLAALPLIIYFVVIHALLAVEARYLYPLRFFAAFLIGGAVFRFVEGRRETRAAAGPRAPFYAALAFTAAAELLLLAYPFRAAAGYGVSMDRAIRMFPGDAWLRLKQGEFLFSQGRPGDGLAALREACAKAGGRDAGTAYIVRTLAAKREGELAPPPATAPGLDLTALYIVKALKELEFGNAKGAEASLAAAYRVWGNTGNISHGPAALPESDAALLEKARGANNMFWDYYVYKGLVYWAPADRGRLLARLEKLTPLTPELAALKRAPAALTFQ
ncbi:MAG: hypothetical protein NTY45_14040 [Elusimicrobia bacterium]|nr:hypothetical protein [Elusimicrobiota bacterium]